MKAKPPQEVQNWCQINDIDMDTLEHKQIGSTLFMRGFSRIEQRYVGKLTHVRNFMQYA